MHPEVAVNNFHVIPFGKLVILFHREYQGLWSTRKGNRHNAPGGRIASYGGGICRGIGVALLVIPVIIHIQGRGDHDHRVLPAACFIGDRAFPLYGMAKFLAGADGNTRLHLKGGEFDSENADVLLKAKVPPQAELGKTRVCLGGARGLAEICGTGFPQGISVVNILVIRK